MTGASLDTNQQLLQPEGSTLLDLTSQYPILRSIAVNLGFWDLVQLSRASVSTRSHCHGFLIDPFSAKNDCGKDIRLSLNIGKHDTTTWRLYKSLTRKDCCEPDHTSDHEALGCKLCSKPVCFACIVKHSFGKPENTFLHRGRALCQRCFATGNPHCENIAVEGPRKARMPYARSGLCHCTSQDGILCSDCKTKQNHDSLHYYKRACAGIDCWSSTENDPGATRICLWCSRVLPGASLRQTYAPRDPLNLVALGSFRGFIRPPSTPPSPESEEAEYVIPQPSFGHEEGEEPVENSESQPNILRVSRTPASSVPPPPDPPWMSPPDTEAPAYSLLPVDMNASRPRRLQV